MAEYYTLLTNAGLAYETACKANGVPIKLSKVSVGDGNGAVYNPDATATALKRELWRGDINSLLQDSKNTNWLLAEVTIPDTVGGWYIREAGIWTETGILYAIIKYPESYKPILATAGAGKEFYIKAIFQTSNAASVTLAVDESIVKATRSWVMDYVSAELAKLDYKQSVRVATTGNITLSGAQTIDGVAVITGDRVLVKNQTAGAENGIYVVANGTWARSADANLSAEVTSEMVVTVEEGTANGDTVWHLTTNNPITLGTTPLTFAQIYTAAQVSTLLAAKAPLASPALTGLPTAPTAAPGTNNSQISNTAFVMNAIATAVSNLVNGAGSALDTLNELAAALGNDPNFATTIANALGLKAPLASPTLTGTPKAPTPAVGTNTDQIQTTAGALAQMYAFGIGSTILPTVTDIDSITTTNICRVNAPASATTVPVVASGVVLTIRFSNTYAAQLYITQSDTASLKSRVFWRTCNSGTWTLWDEVPRLAALATVAQSGKFSDLLDQNDHVMRGAASSSWKTITAQQLDATGNISMEYRNAAGITVMSMQGYNDNAGGWRPRFYYTKSGDAAIDRRAYWFGVNDANVPEIVGPAQIRQGGYLADLTGATMVVKADSNDGTGGLTVNSFAPTIAMVDRSAGSKSSRWRTDGNALALDWDNADLGATWNNPVFRINATGEVISLYSNSYRIISGNYGTFWRNDGSALYLMLTNSGDQYGPWNSLRPFAVNLATGKVDMSNGLNTLTPPRGDSSLSAANTAFVQDAVGTRTGAIDFFALAAVPAGYLKANGAAVSRTTYAALFAAIGTVFGAGDGSTTFNLPDLRGEFVRGLDDGRGVDASRALGSSQSSQNLSHTHTGNAASAGAHTHNTTLLRDMSSYVPGSNENAVLGDENRDGTNTVSTDSAGAHTHAITIAASGGTEARPRNIALLACIKY